MCDEHRNMSRFFHLKQICIKLDSAEYLCIVAGLPFCLVLCEEPMFIPLPLYIIREDVRQCAHSAATYHMQQCSEQTRHVEYCVSSL